ncbi:MAG: acetyltransferase [Paenibacillaceae bacterium]|nr:acetyltransferase [Paenibacillaceae bacterium]
MIEIRPYQDDDLLSLADLMSDLGYPTPPESLKHRMDIMQRLPLYYTFVATIDSEVVGMIGCREVYFYEGDGMAVQISALVTRSKYQGQGVGKAMVSFVERWAKEKGATVIHLTSGNRPERERAHHFYKKMGFDITGYRFVKNMGGQSS